MRTAAAVVAHPGGPCRKAVLALCGMNVHDGGTGGTRFKARTRASRTLGAAQCGTPRPAATLLGRRGRDQRPKG